MFNIDITSLAFSDGAKFADIARNITFGLGYITSFDFWGSVNSVSIKPFMPYSIATFFNLFGVSDFAVIATSFFYFVLSVVFTFLLAQKIYGSKLVSVLTSFAVGFNHNLINYATSGASESPFIFELLAAFYFLSFKKLWGNIVGIVFMALMYFTRPQAIIYIFGLVLYYFVINYSWKKSILYIFISFLIGTVLYGLFSKQGLVAVTQNLPGMAVSDSLRGSSVGFDLTALIKKVFYNLYNFYKALPDIMNPYLFSIFIVGLFSWGKDKLQNSFKISVLFVTLLTFLITALTIPFYRYIHPVVPFVYIVAIAALVDIITYFVSEWSIKNKSIVVGVVSFLLILLFGVGQTLGVIFLDSRFERKMKNTDKAPIYVEMSYKLKEVTDKDMVIVTNLDTWGSWYGERKTIWFPLEPNMILPVQDNIDAIYLTSYKIDDENYYMGEKWREIFNNPVKQTILPDYEFVGEYQFKADDNYEKESGRAVLLKRKK